MITSNQSLLVIIRKVFFISALLACTCLLLSRYYPWISIGFFLCLVGMIVSLFWSIRNEENEKLIIVELLVLCALCASVPLILGWLPWKYSYHHAAFGRYIADHGHIPTLVSAPELPGNFHSWPGFHLLLSVSVIVLGIDPILAYHALCVLLALMAVVFLYLLVKSITQNQQLAAFSAISLGLAAPFIQSMAHEAHSGLAQAMLFLMLYALVERPERMRGSFAFISVLVLIVAIISHHLEPAIYVLILAAIWVYGRRVKGTSLQISSSILMLGIALVIFYWLYVVASSYTAGWIDHFRKEITLVFQAGLPSPFSVIFLGSPDISYPSPFSSYSSMLKNVHWALYLLLGLAGVLVIFLSTAGRWRGNLSKLWFVFPWTAVLLILLAIFITGVGGTEFPIHRILDFLVVPFAIGFAIAILVLLKKSTKVSQTFKLVVSFGFIFVLLSGAVTAFPPELYEGKRIPLTTSFADKRAAVYLGEHTEEGSSVFGDVHTSEAVLYWGYRSGCFDDRIDIVFTSDDALEVEKTLRQFDYASFNIFNTDQEFYYRWAKFGMISADSQIVNIDQYNYLRKIYTSGINVRIYQLAF